MTKKRVFYYLLEQVLSVAGMAVAVFWSAGRVDWWPGWAAIAVWLGYFIAVDIITMRCNPALMVERQAPPRGAKSWDRAIVSTLRLVQLARYILAGLDVRYVWTTGFPLAAQLGGLVVSILGHSLFVWAMAVNAFFSQVVRIQTDRGHSVVQSGPYRFVRHPGYVGEILFDLGISVLFASWWAILAGAVCASLFIVRTALEDRSLRAELPGYADYSHKVRYRLVPGVW
jgi:protein-S-isoprenylcysteine O-methyltransferase Ste14